MRLQRAGACLAAATVGAGLLAGCGSSSSPKTFSSAGIPLHFKYPSDFKGASLNSISKQGGSQSARHSFVGLDSSNLLGVLAYPGLSVTVTPQNLAQVKSSVDAVLSKTAGRTVSSTPMTVHGIPVLAYPNLSAQTPKGKGTDKIYYAFVGTTGYELVCQWTPGNQSKVLAACQQMISTLSK